MSKGSSSENGADIFLILIRDIGAIRRFVCAICLRAVASWCVRVLPESGSF